MQADRRGLASDRIRDALAPNSPRAVRGSQQNRDMESITDPSSGSWASVARSDAGRVRGTPEGRAPVSHPSLQKGQPQRTAGLRARAELAREQVACRMSREQMSRLAVALDGLFIHGDCCDHNPQRGDNYLALRRGLFLASFNSASFINASRLPMPRTATRAANWALRGRDFSCSQL